MSKTHIASVKTKLFQIPGFKFIHKNRITGEGGGVAIYLSDDLKRKQWTDILKGNNGQSVFGWKLTFLKVFLLVAFIDLPTLLVTCEKTLTKIFTKC